MTVTIQLGFWISIGFVGDWDSIIELSFGGCLMVIMGLWKTLEWW